MSRWEALKRDSSKSSKSSSKKKGNTSRNHHLHPTQTSMRENGRRYQSNPKSVIERKFLPDDEILINLKRQLSLSKTHSEGNDDYQSSKVLKSLGDFYEFVKNSLRKEIDTEAFLLVMDLFLIEDSDVSDSASRVLDFAFKEKSISLSKSQAIDCVTRLSRFCQAASSPSKFHKILALLVLSQADNLPKPEEIAQNILAPCLLPCLESGSPDPDIFASVCETLSELFKNTQHRSAIFSPLVEDITIDGKEKKVINPLRRRIFNSLCKCLSQSSSISPSIVCYTLANAIDASNKVDGTLNVTLGEKDLNVSLFQGFFLESFGTAEHSNFVPSIVLFRAILRKNSNGKGGVSKATSDLASRLIMDPVRSNSLPDNCTLCRKRNTELGLFLSIVHHGYTSSSLFDKETINLTTECLADIISTLPWRLWLQISGKSYNKFSMSGFHRKRVDCLLSLISISSCAFRQCDETSILPISHLIKSIFDATQFENPTLLTPAMNLWSTLARYSILPAMPMKVRETVVDTLVYSIGGQETPSGDILPMYAPARVWLTSNYGATFLSNLFTVSKKANSHQHHSIKILSAILRTCPEIISTDSSSLARFQGLLETIYTKGTNEAIHTCLILLKSFMQGRRDFQQHSEGVHISHDIAMMASYILQKLPPDTSIQCQTLSLQIYGTLLSKDWTVLDTVDGLVMGHFESMLSHCEATNGKVRSAACKAIGDFCTAYVPNAVEDNDKEAGKIERISNLVCRSMFVAINDDKAFVRSMALFSLGNLAHSLRSSKIMPVTVEMIMEASTKVQLAMSDANDKVSGNAIRSAGHWGYILIRQENMTTEAAQIVEKTISSLMEILNRTILLTTNGPNGLALTWKQRSTAKKHCWGACNSLGCIFRGLHSLENPLLVVACTEGVRRIIDCVEKYYTMNQKIASSAMSALCEVDSQILAELTGKSGILGETMASCLKRLHELRDSHQKANLTSTRLVEEMEQYLCHILASASIMDASIVLKKDDEFESTLPFLYTWMVQKDLDGRAFEIFALALQRRGILLSESDVSLEQSFASRSLQQYKKNDIISEFEDGAEI